jgi:diacylglycerol kinase family enzyme
MRVAVFHNESAGSKNHTSDEIQSALRAASYEIVAVVSDPDALLAAVRGKPCDLVVVAGGDGTVSGAACALAGVGIPHAILPLGTANNTALTLGVPLAVEGELESVVNGWKGGTLRSFDLATDARAGKVTRFSEAIGWGLFPAAMAKAKDLSSPDERERTLERDQSLFQRVVAAARPERYEITIDGETSSGEYLLVEIMNVRHIGPQLELSPTSDPSDGHLELVLAQESERALLLELAARGTIAAAHLPTRTARHVVVRSGARLLHRDGELVELREPGEPCSVTVAPASVRYLLGVSAAPARPHNRIGGP